MATPLSPEVAAHILEVSQQHPNWTNKDIANEVGVAAGTVHNVLTGKVKVETADRIEKYAKFHRATFLERMEDFKKWIGDTDRPPKPKTASRHKRKKNLVCNDIHAPFHDKAAVGKMIRDNPDADEVWIAGDVMDLFSFSRYEKYSQPFSAVQEFQEGRAFIRLLAERYPKVRVMSGNHDDRFAKWLVRDKSIPVPILEFFKLSDPDFMSPLAKVCAGFDNVEMMEPKELDYAKFPFIHQQGDCILSHAEKFSKIPNRAVGDVIHWLQSYCLPQGIVAPFKVVIQAHTHQAGCTWNDYDVLGIEAGCLAKVPDYAGNARLMGAQRPSVVGYTVVYQENGVTDRNETRFIRL
jgi:transcriptional regulator with XRE-family HTH domain